MSEKDPRAALDLPEPAPKKKTGRPPGAPNPQTLEEALDLCTPKEADFVRHVLAGKTQTDAYALVYDATTPKAQQVNGHRLAQRQRVATALQLGRKAGAIAAISGLSYDIKAADAQLVELIDEARDSDQYSAVANLVRERLKLHRLTDTAPAAAAGASFTLILKAADGAEQVIQPGQVIDIQPAQESEDGDDSDSN